MNYRKLLILFNILFFSVAANSALQTWETISGKVVDAKTGDPLVGVNVIVKSTVLGASTDINGTFIIRVSMKKAVIEASMIGYEHQKKFWKAGQGEIVFKLKQAAIPQEPLIVTATKSKKYVENSPVSIEVVRRSDIVKRNPVSIDEVLSTSSSVRIIDGQLDIRGSTGFNWSAGSRVLLLVDGHPMISGDAGSINWDIIPVDEVERVEILKGAGSALYGSNAMAGVVNIITKEPSILPVTRYKTYWGVYDEPAYAEWRWTNRFLPGQIRRGERIKLKSALGYKGFDITHTRHIGKVGLLLSLGSKQSTGYQENGDFIKFNALFKAKAPVGQRGHLDISAQWANNNHGDFLQWKSQNSPLEVPEEELGNRVKYMKESIFATYKHLISRKWALTTKAHWYRCDWHNYFYDNRDYAVTDRIGTEVQADYVNGIQSLTIGTEGTYYKTESLIYGNRFVWDVAVYAEDEITISKKVRAILGARYDFHVIDTLSTDQQISPRTGIIFKPWQFTSLRASVGHGFRAPSIAEVFATTSASGFRVVGNPDLNKAERSWNFETGIRQTIVFPRSGSTKQGFFANPVKWFLQNAEPAFIIDLSFFWMQYKNMIDVTMNPDEQAFQFVNIGRARNRGLELLLKMVGFGRVFTGTIGYTYLDPEDLATGKILNYRSRNRFTAGFDLNFKKISIGMDYRYASRIEEVVNIYNSDERVPIYVIDMRSGYKFSKFQLNFDVKNLRNYHYTLRQRYLEPVRSYVFTFRGLL